MAFLHVDAFEALARDRAVRPPPRQTRATAICKPEPKPAQTHEEGSTLFTWMCCRCGQYRGKKARHQSNSRCDGCGCREFERLDEEQVKALGELEEAE